MTKLCWVLLTIALLLLLACGWLLTPALAHLHDRPELDAWFNGLQSSGGFPCCAQIDGSTVADIDWDTTVVDGKIQYRVFVEGQWVTVTDQEVVTVPNRAGAPIVWVYHQCDANSCKPVVRCFLPGAGG